MISACLICLNEERFIKMCLDSIEGIVDEIIIVDGGSTDKTLEIIDSLKSKKIKVIHNKWGGDYGKQRQIAVNWASGDFCLQIDPDEILGDTGYLLKEYEKNGTADVYGIEYIHFIRDFGHVDATLEKHITTNRFFRNKGVNYSLGMHELANSTEWKSGGFIEDIKVYHLGGLKDVFHFLNKYNENTQKSKIHNPEFLKQWRDWYVFGTYPIKQFTGEYPMIIKELIG